MKIFEVESIYGGEISIVKTRKNFQCLCCEELKQKGTMSKVFKCANSNDFFSLRFCLDCEGKYQIKELL